MRKGYYISGAGHLALIGWLLFGGVFRPDPPPVEMTEVSVITGAEFDALLAAQVPPDSVSEVAQPEAPQITPDAPEVAATVPDEAIEQPAPVQAETPPSDPVPEVSEAISPPAAVVGDEPPVLDEPVGDVAVLVPETAPVAAPRPVERVAPQPVAEPAPDVTPDPEEQTAVAPDQPGETPQDPQEARAPEEATTEIVTEATAAPAASPRPPGRRPTAPTPQVAETTKPAQPSRPAETPPAQDAPIEDPTAAAIEAAIAAATAAAQQAAETPANPAPSGPPLNAGEKENLRVAVSNCWNVDVGGRSASTVVTVAVSLDRSGRVVGDVRLLSSEGGDEAAVSTAFQSARRAILRCQRDGYPLPPEKYDHWREIEMTFNPEKMRVK